MTDTRKQVIGEFTSTELDEMMSQGWFVKRVLNKQIIEAVYECILEMGTQPTDLQEDAH